MGLSINMIYKSAVDSFFENPLYRGPDKYKEAIPAIPSGTTIEDYTDSERIMVATHCHIPRQRMGGRKK